MIWFDYYTNEVCIRDGLRMSRAAWEDARQPARITDVPWHRELISMIRGEHEPEAKK